VQNRYVGDIGDYGKFGLLRILSEQQLRIGVQWYHVPDEGHNKDGKHINYLTADRFRNCDPYLFDTLKKLVQKRQRNLAAIESSKIFGPEATFFSEELSFNGMAAIGKAAREARLNKRAEWNEKALQILGPADVVFFDPDNGLEIPSKLKNHKTGPKHVFWDEIRPFHERGQSVVIYHHLGRTGGSHEEQIATRLKEAKKYLQNGKDAFALRFSRGTSRSYIMVPNSKHVGAYQNLISTIVDGSWNKHFSVVH